MLGLYMGKGTDDYDWLNGRDSEAFGACIGNSCGGMWLSAAYIDSTTTYYYAEAINF